MNILELHVKGFTVECPLVSVLNRGKFLGLCEPAMIDHYKSISIDTLQLMPVFDSKDSFWGYDPTSWTELNPEFGTLEEFKIMLATLKENGIKVILDVVYNHTHKSRSIPGVVYSDFDTTGCGQAVDVGASLPVIMRSIHYWLRSVGVDGMRFDLAVAVGRENGRFNPNGKFFKAMEQYSDKILIAEPWDMFKDDSYQLGNFPSNWLELDGKFSNEVKSGDESSCSWHLEESRAVAYVICHDSFTLADFVSYSEKHNHANGEDNRDGNDNHSWNNGVEGPTDDPIILERRESHKAWLMKQLWDSPTHRMFAGGDAFGNTNWGNSNPWNQDNETGWVNWDNFKDQ